MGEFNSFVKEGEVYLKAFAGAKTNQLNYQIIPVIQVNHYDAVAIHVGINDLLSSNKYVNDICRGIISIGLRCRSNNISKVFICSIAYSSKINSVLMRRLNRALYGDWGEMVLHSSIMVRLLKVIFGLMEFICKKAVNALLQII